MRKKKEGKKDEGGMRGGGLEVPKVDRGGLVG